MQTGNHRGTRIELGIEGIRLREVNVRVGLEVFYICAIRHMAR